MSLICRGGDHCGDSGQRVEENRKK
jgi:hypothetical protein